MNRATFFAWIFAAAVVVSLAFVAAVNGDELSECRRLAPKYEAELEVRLWDGTRVDMLSDEWAIEVDWSGKWAESIGQSLYYAELTGRKPGIILLVKDVQREMRYVHRCQVVCARVGIRLWVEEAEDE